MSAALLQYMAMNNVYTLTHSRHVHAGVRSLDHLFAAMRYFTLALALVLFSMRLSLQSQVQLCLTSL